MREMLSCLSGNGGKEALIPMQPSPRAETSRLLFPSLRFCILLIPSTLSDLSFSALIQADALPALQFSRQHFQSRGDRRLLAERQRLYCSPQDVLVSLCRGSEQSRASGPATTPAQLGQGWPA